MGELGVLVRVKVRGDVVGECLEVRKVLSGLYHWGVKVRGGGDVARDKMYGEVVQDVLNGSEVGLGLREVGGRFGGYVGEGGE